MKHITKLKLAAVHQYADTMDKSTEWMLQFMQDSCNVDLDCVISYMSLGNETHKELFNEINELTNVIIKTENI